MESSYNTSSDVFFADIALSVVDGGTQLYFAQVRRTFKGCVEKKRWVVLQTPVDEAACGVTLPPGKYLIQGHRAGTRFDLPAFSIGLCDYNKPVADLTDDDRAFLEDRNVCCGDECSCADGSTPYQCFVDPCQVAPACEEGQCVANYCGGCNAEFYDAVGRAVCQAGPEAESSPAQ